MGNNRWVHLMFAVGGLLLAFVVDRMIAMIWGYFAKPPAMLSEVAGLVIGGGAALVAWKNEKFFTRAQEIVMELSKVTWPTRKETSAATVVVIVTVIIASIILSLFDLIWSWATGLIYS